MNHLVILPTVYRPYPRTVESINHLQMSEQRQHFLKDPECWSGRGFNPRPPARKSGTLPTEPTGRRLWSLGPDES